MRRTAPHLADRRVVFTLVFGLAYPLAFTGVAQVALPGQGGRLEDDGGRQAGRLEPDRPGLPQPVIGKNGKPKLDEEGEEMLVPDKRYFQPRPSQTGYAATSPSSATSGPTASKSAKRCGENLAAYLKLERPLRPGPDRGRRPSRRDHAVGVRRRPAHLRGQRPRSRRTGSPRSASLPLAEVEDLISDHTDGRFLGLFGEPGVNVLELNLALDKEAPIK